MTERDVREALTSDVLDALHEAHRQPGSITMPELAQAVAAALAPVVVGMLAEAEQRGREDNADHGMCYVHGSKALDARLAEARAEALREVAQEARERGDIGKDGGCEAWTWLRIRADRIATASPEPATGARSAEPGSVGVPGPSEDGESL